MEELYFDKLGELAERYKVAKSVFHDKAIRIVGGAIRDSLLGIKKDINDIDLACEGKPDELYQYIQSSTYSHYMTEKYGTLTFVDYQQKNDEGQLRISYELTPFRAESNYIDKRHPEQISRTHSLSADAGRRDFTINAMYYGVSKVELSVEGTHNYQPCRADLLHANHGAECIHMRVTQEEEAICIVRGIDAVDTAQRLCKDSIVKRRNSAANKSIIYGKGQYIISKIHIILDPYDGSIALSKRKISCVGDPNKRFSEDGLRVIRALRMVNILNQNINLSIQEHTLDPPSFDITTDTRISLKKHFYTVKSVARERIKDEIIKVFAGSNPSGFVAMIEEVNLLDYIFPYVAKTKNVNQPVRYHSFDVYAHTLLALYYLQQFNTDRRVKLAMLYHDVGKPDQYYYTSILTTDEERKRVAASPLNHPVSGTWMLESDMRSLGVSTKNIRIMQRYIKHHMAPGMVMQGTKKNIYKKLRSRISERGEEQTKNLLDITKADRLGQCNPVQEPNTDGIECMKLYVDDIIQQEGRFTMKDLAVGGKDIMQHFDLSPSPLVGRYLHEAFDRVIDNIAERNTKERILDYLERGGEDA